MLCSRCHKRPAVVFITKVENNETKNEGLCLVCAKELGIKPIDNLMKKFNISDEEMEAMTEQMAELLNPEDEDNDDENEENGDAFEAGGSVPLPFMQNLGSIFSNAKEDPKAALGEDNSQATNEKDEKGKKSNDKKEKKPKLKYLNNYCQNLTERAREGKLDNIIGRDEEIYRVLQILNRRTKNNPCLIGEPGVGKTAIAEGLAIRIATGVAPAKLLRKELYLLDLTALIAGTQFRGQFESRVKGLVEEVKKIGNIILFIDEIHNLVGAGDAEGSMNAANMLKPALSRGEIQVIGATTLTEYRKYIEKDAALERRFQPVTIPEPTKEDTIKILMGIKGYYEQHHNVTITEKIVREAVYMSEKYVTDRFLPDKAIDLIDEACSNSGLTNKDAESLIKNRYKEEDLNAELLEVTGDTENENFEKIAKIKSEILKTEEEIKDLEPKAMKKEVTSADLARVIELWTGIPASKIQKTEANKLLDLKEQICSKIVGQDEAVDLIVKAVKRARASIVPRNRPVSFIFTGPTGVGKTELVKVLAKELYDTPDSLIRLDMSEFMEKHAVSRIIGSPPGYVGYDEAGQLTEKIRRKPHSIILFDEIEKAHPEVLNILLQILDEGKITDSHGKVVNFENTFIVMTSNAGSNIKGNAAGFNKTATEITKEKAQKALTEFLRPEFLNRIDEVIVFAPLLKEQFMNIADIMLKEFREGLSKKSITFKYDEKVLKFIADKAYSVEYGARNIRREIQKEIEDKLVDYLLDNDNNISSISLTATDTEIIFDIK
ncbi:MAG: AAA family ATPase [Clostridia bacterium]